MKRSASSDGAHSGTASSQCFEAEQNDHDAGGAKAWRVVVETRKEEVDAVIDLDRLDTDSRLAFPTTPPT